MSVFGIVPVEGELAGLSIQPVEAALRPDPQESLLSPCTDQIMLSARLFGLPALCL